MYDTQEREFLLMYFPCVRRNEKSVPVPCLWQSVVLESESEEARGRQARVQTGRVPVRHMRTGVLFAQLTDDAYLHIP